MIKTYVLIEQQYINDELEKAINIAQENDNLDIIAVLYPLQNYIMKQK